jgi:two-component system, LuxR family, sensor kinase FixL
LIHIEGLQGSQCKLIILLNDVTQYRKVLENASSHAAELARMHRIYSLYEMNTILAHELNNPLGAIVNYANASLRRIGNDQYDIRSHTRALESIREQATRASRLLAGIRKHGGGKGLEAGSPGSQPDNR